MQHTDAIEILERMYASEINFKIETFWDNGFEFYLYNSGEHIKIICFNFFLKINDGIFWLANSAAKHYPQSTFAKWWRENGK